MTDDEIREKQKALWPQVIGAVITKSKERANLCPVTFQAVSSVYEKPLTVCVGLTNTNFSLENIVATKEFVFSYPTKHQLEDILYCGTVSGRQLNKLRNTQLEFEKATAVQPPLLKNAAINFECRLVHTYKQDTFTLVVGEVVMYHSTNELNLDKVYALGGTDFGVISDVEVLAKQDKA